MYNKPVTDKGRAHGCVRQMIGCYQLGQLQPNSWMEAGFLKQLLCPVMEIIARIQQDKFQIPDGIQCHAGTIRLHVTLIHNVIGIQTPVNQAGIDFEGFGNRQQNVSFKGRIPLKILHEFGIAVKGDIHLPPVQHLRQNCGAGFHQVDFDPGIFPGEAR